MRKPPSPTRTTKERCREVMAWLRRTFPPPIPVRLRVVEQIPEKYGECLGICVWSDDHSSATMWVRKTTRSETLSTIMHEYCHVLTSGRGECDGHGDKFYLKLGEIERAFHYQGGDVDSKTKPRCRRAYEPVILWAYGRTY